MKIGKERIETLLASVEPSRPPHPLRERVLERAGEALDRPLVRDAWTRIYSSRPLRAAWAATVLALLAAHLLLPRGARPSAGERLAASSSRLVPEVRDVVSVPRLDEALASIDRLAYARPAGAAPAPAGRERKENRS